MASQSDRRRDGETGWRAGWRGGRLIYDQKWPFSLCATGERGRRRPDRRTAEGRRLTKRQRLGRVNDLPTHRYILPGCSRRHRGSRRLIEAPQTTSRQPAKMSSSGTALPSEHAKKLDLVDEVFAKSSSPRIWLNPRGRMK